MKRLVYIPLILLSITLNAQETEAETYLEGERCVINRHGYCYVKPVEEGKGKEGNTRLKLLNNELVFEIYRDRITIEEETMILGKKLMEEGTDIFIMEGAFDLSEDLRNALGINEETIIPAGEYPVKITVEIVEIKFALMKK